MAVKPMVRDFWPRFKRQAISLVFTIHLISTGLTAGWLWYFDLFHSHFAESLIILISHFVAGGLLLIVLCRALVEPTKKLIATVVHAANEKSAMTPPNPNEKSLQKSGLGVVVQAIYSLLTARPTVPTENDDSDTPKPQTRLSTETLERALDDTICGLVIINSERKIIYANKAAPVNIDNDGVITLDLLFDQDGALSAWWDECNENSVKAERTWSRVSNKLPNEEGRRFFDVVASYNKGVEHEMILMLVDRTHLYKVGEEELDFIAFAAHELRGPITVIRGYIDVLQEELDQTIGEDQKELFRRLSVSATRLSGYINNILNTSRHDRRHLKMHLAETTVADVYNTIRDDMSLRASSQNRLLNVDIPTDLPTIAADTASLGEVLANIIDNAIKYSNEGGVINVTANMHGEFVDIAIQDHGIGMPGNVIGNLFQKFYRSHRSRETVAGTGIGLYISKAIVESHGGTIGVRSEEGRGSVFTVSLPTYRSIADKLKSGSNEYIISKKASGVWIKNHSAFRG